jgi:hypothetical protein
VPGVDCLPFVGEEDMINTLERRVLPLVAPGEKSSVEVGFLQRRVV